MTLLVLQDGLYRYVWRNVVVGFVVQGGELRECAPFLRAMLNDPRKRGEWLYRMTTAERIGP